MHILTIVHVKFVFDEFRFDDRNQCFFAVEVLLVFLQISSVVSTAYSIDFFHHQTDF